MTREKNPPCAAAILGAVVVALLGALACQRDSQPSPSAAAAAMAHRTSPASPAAPAAIAPTAAGAGGAPLPVPGQPVTSELQRQPQSVRVGDAPPAPAAAPAQSTADRDLVARERRLAARVAALEAREKQLRQNEGVPPAPASAAAAAVAADQAGAPEAAPPDAAAGNAPLPGAAGDDGAAAAGGASAAVAGEPPPWRGEEPAPAPLVTVPVGTQFEVAFTKGLASNTSSVGQTFRARLLSDVRLDGSTAIPAGSEILGVVTDAVGAKRIGGQAKLSLKFTDLVLPSGSTVPIHASFLEEGKSKAGRDAATIGGSAAGGALLGNILGRSGRGTILGALVGAAVGTAIASKTAGEEVVIPEGSVVKLKLDDPLVIKPRG